MPPPRPLTVGTGNGLVPGRYSIKKRNILDVDENRKYQFNNSLQELLLLSGVSNGAGPGPVTPLFSAPGDDCQIV